MTEYADRRSSDIQSVKTDVEILKRDVSNIHATINRLDTAIDKIADASSNVSEMLAVHQNSLNRVTEDIEERKRVSERSAELLHRRISEMKDESAEHHRINHEAVMGKLDKMDAEVTKELKTVSERVSVLEKWKWWVMGGSWAIGFAIASIANVSKLFE